ncbi:MAG: transcription elongation factor GreB [Kistimonas sp.]|nr:transcription elongation factor GreB [Kistimonas sp.]
MSRYRPPQPAASLYITPEGYQKLRQEHDLLWRTKRPEVTQAVAEAAALGDRSENAEYIYGKKQLREIDRRILYLRRRLDRLQVVDQPPSDPGRIFFGAWVTLQDEEGQTSRIRLVGPDEIEPSRGWISIDAPLSRTLLGKAEGTEVEHEASTGSTLFEIVSVTYQQPEEDKS